MTRSFHVASVLVGLFTVPVFALNIETVHVGDPGNMGEQSRLSSYGDITYYGSVDYEYNIGKYEVTAGQYTEFLNKVAATDAYGLYRTEMASTSYGSGITRNGTSGSYTYSVASAFVNRPVNYVNFWDACRFSNWLNNGQLGADTTETGAYTLTVDGIKNNTVARNADWKWAVTSEDEWYKAAYYKGKSTNAGYWVYPTSSDAAPGRDMADAFGNNANYFVNSDPRPIDSGKYTTVVGEFQNSASPYGTFDQGGNVYEWTDFTPMYGTIRCIRGGSLVDEYNLLASERITSWTSTSEAYITGFRVVEVPEPTTMALLALGGFGLLRKHSGLGK